MGNSQTLSTMATLYKTGTSNTLNLPNAQSQFQVNGVNIGRDLTSTLVTTRVPATITLQTSASNSYVSTIPSTTTNTIYTNTINGVSSVNIDWATTASVLPITAPLQISGLTAFGSVFPNMVPLAQLNGPAPSNNLTISFPINVYISSTGDKLNGYGGVVRDINGAYWVVFASYTNLFGSSFPISFDPFQFTYQ
jgi:hypothetical protein